MGSHPVILNGKGAAAVMVTAWASWVPAVSVLCPEGVVTVAAPSPSRSPAVLARKLLTRTAYAAAASSLPVEVVHSRINDE